MAVNVEPEPFRIYHLTVVPASPPPDAEVRNVEGSDDEGKGPSACHGRP